MAGVYIKVENIPYGCAVCPCCNWEQGFCQVFDDFREADDDKTRPDWCPLVEVPDHGDLIDRDEMLKEMENFCNRRCEDAAMTGNRLIRVDWVDALNFINGASVVIPAERIKDEID